MQEWKAKVTIEATDVLPNSWAAKIEACKAMRAYSVQENVRLQDVTEDMVKATQLGLKGYASLYSTLPAAAPKKGGDGTNNHPAPPAPPGNKRRRGEPDAADDSVPAEPEKKARGKKDNTGAKKEKEVKEFLAMEQAADNVMSKLATAMGKDPSWYAWATEAVTKYKAHRTTLLRGYCDEAFFQAVKVAALSPKETAKLKKEYQDEYVGKLVQFVTTMGPLIQQMAETAFQIEHMASAKRSAAESLKSQWQAPKAKAKPRSKRVSRTSSSKSLPSV